MNTTEITLTAPSTIPAADAHLVIDDGQFRYAVDKEQVKDWIAKHWKVPAQCIEECNYRLKSLGNAEAYTDFCRSVEVVGPAPGSKECIEFCENLINSGTQVIHV